MKIERKPVTLLVGLVLAGLVGFAVGQTLIERRLTASVTARTEGDFGFYDPGGAPVTGLDFGELGPGDTASRTVIVRNTGNVALNVTGDRTDSVGGIAVRYLNPDGSGFDAASLRLMAPSEEVAIVMEVTIGSGVVGSHELEFLFVGEEA